MSTIDEAAAFLRGAGLHYARRQLRERRLPTALVEDVVQEALVAVLRAVEADREIDNVEAYVTRVVRNVVVDFVRGKANRPEAASWPAACTTNGAHDDASPGTETPPARAAR